MARTKETARFRRQANRRIRNLIKLLPDELLLKIFIDSIGGDIVKTCKFNRLYTFLLVDKLIYSIVNPLRQTVAQAHASYWSGKLSAYWEHNDQAKIVKCFFTRKLHTNPFFNIHQQAYYILWSAADSRDFRKLAETVLSRLPYKTNPDHNVVMQNKKLLVYSHESCHCAVFEDTQSTQPLTVLKDPKAIVIGPVSGDTQSAVEGQYERNWKFALFIPARGKASKIALVSDTECLWS
ncbi:hypothetical protein HK097_009041 [Rhizophlyctis rosea]|uniref:Uncharacterized protein n=1 Tax=Rhizophlyctis rosea TaxID=64517 RepID=A0AAD5SKY8_9FUNG|nr:hypothetical protein HK097_009041 [Rhizophlyctis rosea]